MNNTAVLMHHYRTQADENGYFDSDYPAAAAALDCPLSDIIAMTAVLEEEHKIRPQADGRWFVNTRKRAKRLRELVHPQLEAFCQAHDITHSKNYQSFYFTLGGRKFLLSNHSVELSNLGRSLQQLPLAHPEGREAGVTYIHAPKEQLTDIYTQLQRECAPCTSGSIAENPAAEASRQQAPTQEEKVRAYENRLLQLYRRQANARGLFNMDNRAAMQELCLTNRCIQLLAQRLRLRGCIPPTGAHHSYRWRLTA